MAETKGIQIVIDGSSSDQRNNEKFLRDAFEIFVRKINSVLYAEKFKYKGPHGR